MSDQFATPTLPPRDASMRELGAAAIKHASAPKPRKRKAKSKKLGSSEVKKLNAKRSKSLKGNPYPPKPANPNRPLEMKNKLHAVLELSGALRKPQLVAFAELMSTLEKMPRGARKTILTALVQVYG